MELDQFCSSGDFTDKLSQFINKHCQLFVHGIDEEQPIEMYSIFLNYIKLIEHLLQGLI